VLVRVDSIKEPATTNSTKQASYLQQLHQITGDEVFQSYLADAIQHAKITMRPFSVEEGR
jgi:hypothetical protein